MSEAPFIFDVTEQEFAARVIDASAKAPVLVDFWAAWCGPCKMLMPLLTQLAEAYAGQFLLAKVNIDEQSALATRFGVRSVPTVKVIRHGKVVDEFMGALPESEIRRVIERHIERESDRIVATALQQAETGDLDGALAAVDALLEQEPDDFRARIVRAELLMRAGQYSAASVVIEGLPADIRLEPDVEALAARLEFARAAEEAPASEALQRRLAADPGDSEARYQLASLHLVAGDYEGAAEQLFELMRRDRGYRDDAGRKGLLKIFELLGNDGELVHRYRRKMASALY